MLTMMGIIGKKGMVAMNVSCLCATEIVVYNVFLELIKCTIIIEADGD
jgi:hypothetical protein